MEEMRAKAHGQSSQRELGCRTWNSIILILLLLLLFVLPAENLFGMQLQLSWAPVQSMPGQDNSADAPVMVTDGSGTTHTFNSKDFNGVRSIIYSRWTRETGWTAPNDIIYPPLVVTARPTDAYIDENGIIHLIFFSGADFQANIYYTFAHVSEADRAPAWSPPTVVGENALMPIEAQISGHTDGSLSVVYSGNTFGNGVYAIHSLDNGRNWQSAATPIFLTNDVVIKPHAISVDNGPGDVIHAVWSTVNERGIGQGIYYSRFQPQTSNWTLVEQLDTPSGAGADTPAVVANGEQVVVIYHNGFPTTRWMRLSSDAGATWRSPTRLFAYVGSNGPAEFVVDSGGTLHLFFGNRIGDPAIHGMWHATWDGERWSEPQAVSSGSRIVDEIGGDGFDPSFASATVVQGNLILLTWRTDPGAGANGIWFTYTQLQTPPILEEVPPAPSTISQPTATTTPALPPTATMEASSVVPPDFLNTNEEVQQNNLSLPILIGILPVLLIVIVLIIRTVMRNERQF